MADEINYVVGNAATLKIQALWRRSLVRERTYVELKAVWEKIFDPVQQIYYYYNTVTDEASWKRPAPLLWRDLGDVALRCDFNGGSSGFALLPRNCPPRLR